jgi:hypothetical protein
VVLNWYYFIAASCLPFALQKSIAIDLLLAWQCPPVPPMLVATPACRLAAAFPVTVVFWRVHA